MVLPVLASIPLIYRSTAASQKAAAADAARAGQSEATAAALREQLAMAAAASAKLQEQLATAQSAALQRCRDHEQAVAGHQAELVAAHKRLKSAQEIADQATARAEALTGELEGIKQEVAEWARLRCEHQQVLQVNAHNQSAPSASSLFSLCAEHGMHILYLQVSCLLC